MKKHLGWLIACVAIAPPFAAGQGGDELRLVVALNNQAAYDEEVLAKTKDIVTGIFRELGAVVEWRNGPEGADLLVNLVRVSGTFMGFEGTGLAALPEAGRMGYLIWVFKPAVEKMLDERWLKHASREGLLPVLLGHVIAHEMGHQLLGTNRHAGSGIMKADWHQQEIQLAYQGDLRFQPKQSERIREAVRARNALPYRATLGHRE